MNDQTKAISEDDKKKIIDAYKIMLLYQFGGMFVLVLLLATLMFLAYFVHEKWQPTILMLAALTGMLGAFFSALARLRGADELALGTITPVMKDLPKLYLAVHSMIPPLVGGVAALVLYVAFVGDLLAGQLFPEMHCKKDGVCNQLIGVIDNFGPKEAKDYGKMLVWSFIAGFSERFVPDTLQTLAAKSRDGE